MSARKLCISVFACNLLLVVSASASIAKSQTYTWRRQANVDVSGWREFRNTGMTFDSLRNRAVLLSETACGGVGGMETWEYDGVSWQQRLSVASPPCRGGFAVAYDVPRSRTVLFGGGGGYGDTWLWDGSNWATRFPPVSPSPRSGHAMTYDASRGKVVLFGGISSSSALLSDLWDWDGSSWSQVNVQVAPPGRAYHSLSHDPARGMLVTYGGFVAQGTPFVDETWEFDGAQWQMRSPVNRPAPLARYSMHYDPLRSRVVMFGGYYNLTNFMYNQTWEWDGSDWTMVTLPTIPAGRVGSSTVFFPPSGKVLMVGGESNQAYVANEFWTLGIEPGAVPGTAVSFGQGCGSPALQLSTFNGSRPILGQTLSTRIDHAVGGTAFMAIGLNANVAGPFVLPFDLGGFGMIGCTLYHDCGLQFASSCTPIGASSARHDFVIQNIPSMLRLPFLMQAWSIDIAANSAGVIASNGIQMMIGDV